MSPWLSLLLAPLSWIYGAFMQVRRWAYAQDLLKSHRLPGHTISIGNIEVGGTGKSPFVILLAEALIKRGERPAILTRGYKSGLAANESATLLDGQVILPPQQAHFQADEARMQSARLPSVPVIIGAQRWQAALRFLQHHGPPSVWILDDGFQHLKIQRDEDWVLLDENRPLANGRVLPAGRLREWPRVLFNCQRVFFTRARLDTPACSLQKQLEQKAIPCGRIAFENGPPYAADGRGQSLLEGPLRCSLILGIARPEALAASLAQKGWQIEAAVFKRDHEPISADELDEIARKSPIVLTSEKDYYRDKAVFSRILPQVYILPLELKADKELL